MKAVVVSLVAGVLLFLLTGWISMLALGAAHSHDARVPAFGFETVLWLTVAFSGLVAGARAGGDK